MEKRCAYSPGAAQTAGAANRNLYRHMSFLKGRRDLNFGVQMINQSELRLSAQRALLGRVYVDMRLIKVKSVGSNILLTVVLDREPSEAIREDISVATAEIIADFPEAAKMEEKFHVNTQPIPAENVLTEGWVYRRAE